MLRALILLGLAAGIGLISTPFILASRALDENGVRLRGVIQSRSEYVRLHYSQWERLTSVTVKYDPPDTGGVSFFEVNLGIADYDALHITDSVSVRYLLPKDTPDVPLAGALRQMHALPMVKLGDRPALSKLHVLNSSAEFRVMWKAGVFVLGTFLLWRLTRLSLLGWVALLGAVATWGMLEMNSLPRPTPPPSTGVQRGTGTVKSVDNIHRLFQGDHEQGLAADQPVEVVGVEFVPSGWTQSVVAVDLIDQGSIAGLKDKATVPIDYEIASPRTAYLRGASRNFAARNVRGTITNLVMGAVTVAILLLMGRFIGWGYRRLSSR